MRDILLSVARSRGQSRKGAILAMYSCANHYSHSKGVIRCNPAPTPQVRTTSGTYDVLFTSGVHAKHFTLETIILSNWLACLPGDFMGSGFLGLHSDPGLSAVENVWISGGQVWNSIPGGCTDGNGQAFSRLGLKNHRTDQYGARWSLEWFKVARADAVISDRRATVEGHARLLGQIFGQSK